jgi:hypothetical protein
MHIMVQGPARTKRHEDQIALGRFSRLADRFRHFARLAVTEANAALLVTNNHQGCETEAAAALDDLGNAVDVYELVNEFAVALFFPAAIVAATFLGHCPFPYSFPESIGWFDLEAQAAFAGSFCEGLDAAMIDEGAAVERPHP